MSERLFTDDTVRSTSEAGQHHDSSRLVAEFEVLASLWSKPRTCQPRFQVLLPSAIPNRYVHIAQVFYCTVCVRRILS